ncbi:helicase SNF2 [Candidatus Woesearchaeota archaeon]|nr:helicase SNF2 [Candidatus Woesearchaeota archaeon]
MSIDSIQLKPELNQAVKKEGFTEWTTIQEKCIPLILEGKDVVGKSKTGSGKTAAFCLPVLNKLQPGKLQVLVLTPTRELCSQVADVFQNFGKTVGVNVVQVYGGVGYEPQEHGIQTSEILVGTPGRVLDHIERGTLNLETVKWLILDEADRMFEMGFIEDVERIISDVSSDRQTLLFSATVGEHIYKLAEKHLRDPVTIKGEDKVDHSQLKQEYFVVDRREKFSALVHFLREKTDGLALVFCATRREASLVAKNLQNNKVKAMGIHGGMTQNKREHALQSLHDAKIQVLVATDVAARGLDIKDVTHVYNYDVPPTSDEYIHRIGRTARAGESGDAVTLLSERDYDNFNNVLEDATLKIQRGDLPKFNKVAFNPFAEKPGGRGRMPQRRRTDRPRFGSFRR